MLVSTVRCNATNFVIVVRSSPIRIHRRRDRGRDGEGAKVPAADDGRLPHQGQRGPNEEKRRPSSAPSRVLQSTIQVRGTYL